MSVRKIVGSLKKQWITIWLVIASAMFATVVSYALYEESDVMMKRVVAPAAMSGGLFSSNYLEQGDVKNNRSLSYNHSYDLHVRNYNQSDPGTVYDGEIKYDMTITLVHSDADATPFNETDDSDELERMKTEGHTITVKKPDGTTVSFGWDGSSYKFTDSTSACSLNDTSEEDGIDTWEVTYSQNFPYELDMNLMFEADPMTNNPDLYVLSGIIGIAEQPEVRSEDWSCVLNDNIAGYEYDDYDAFNYLISGTGNKQLIFSYNSAYVEINPSFAGFIAGEAHVTGTDGGWKTVTIDAKPNLGENEEGKTNASRYDIQVYKKTDAENAKWTSETIPAIPDKSSTSAYIRFDKADYPSA